MLTRNFYVGLCAIALFGDQKYVSDISMSFRDTGGTYRKIYGNQASAYSGYNNKIALIPISDNLRFGTNDAEETFGDYNVVRSNLNITTGAIAIPSYDNSNKTYTITQRYIINNATANSITLNEFGIIGYLKQDDDSYTNALIYRKKLDSPFTIEANETVNFDLTAIYEMLAEYEPYVPV